MAFWVAGAVAVAGVGTAVATSSAAKSAAKAQTNAANAANQTALDQYNQTRADQAPWRAQGETALNQLSSNLQQGFNAGDLANEPGYQFGLQQGQQALDRSAAAGGGLYSGAQLKAASTFANNFAGTKYNDAYNRWIQNNNELAGLAGVGQTATTNTDSAGQTYANTYGTNTTSAGNVAASGYLAQGNSLSNALNQGSAALQYGLNNRSGSSSSGYGYGSSGGGVGTGAYYDSATGTTYNNPSAYVGP